MYQAIEVKFLPITTYKGARYKAFAQAGSVTITKEYGLTDIKEATRAAFKLAYKLGWNGEWVAGQLKNGNYVFVLRSNLKDGSFRVI